MGSGNCDSRSLLCILHFQDIELDVLGRLEFFSLYLLALLENCIDLAQININVMPHIALNNSCHHVFFLAVPLIKQGCALLLTDLLENYIFRVLRSDTAKFLGINIHTDNVAVYVSRI